LIWFGVIIAMNLQTSFLTPPFGFALFYLRSVAAKKDYKDLVTGETIPAVQTSQIYKGSIAFICLQLVMVVAVIVFPGLVIGGIDKGVTIDADKALQMMQDKAPAEERAAPPSMGGAAEPAAPASAASPASGASTGAGENKDDPMRALLESMKTEQGAKKP
jgi:hypothetical protein